MSLSSRQFLSLLLPPLLVACAHTGGARYSCGVPEGQPCLSAPQVHAMMDVLEPITSAAGPHSESVLQIEPRKTPDSMEVAQTGEGELILQAPAATLRLAATELHPVRLPARVMRIWIAPWQDHAGDFIAAAHLYTEIEPARWLHATQPLPDPPRLERIDAPVPAIDESTTKSRSTR